MSYEGYERFLCANGHLATFDCYDLPSSSHWLCGICGSGIVWSEAVDETNGEGRPTKLTVKTTKMIEVPDTYDIPVRGRVNYSKVEGVDV